MEYLPIELIKRKRDRRELSESEIYFFIKKYTQGQIADYQMSSFLMAIYLNGMSPSETLALTRSMLESGKVVTFETLKSFKVDKHSTGGVGDKTSLLLGPIVAAAGVPVPMISGRGLGHTGGTLDKLESIPGFNTQLSLSEFKTQVETLGLCYIGQTSEICPADKKIYSLRDVTGTVESIPLITASILSKKMAEGIDGIVFDVKFGNGAFMKSLDQAKELGKSLENVCSLYNKKVSVVYSNMNQPLGRFAGNLLEIWEVLEILKGNTSSNKVNKDLYADTRELSLLLSAKMIQLAKNLTLEEAYNIAKHKLISGEALKMFEKVCTLQGGKLNEISFPQNSVSIRAESEGFVQSFNTENIGLACILMRAGRQQITDTLDYSSGIEFHVKIGDFVRINDPVFTLHGNNPDCFKKCIQFLKGCYTISLQKISRPDLIID